MPYAPGVQYDARPLYEGLAAAGRQIAAAREAEWQREFLREQLARQQAYGDGIHADELTKDYFALKMQDDARQRALDAQYGFHEDELAKDYFAIEQQNARAKEATAPYAPPPEALQAAKAAGYFYVPQSRHGGSYVPRRDLGTAPAIGSDPTGTGNYFWDGKTLKRKRKEAAAPAPRQAAPPEGGFTEPELPVSEPAPTPAARPPAPRNGGPVSFDGAVPPGWGWGVPETSYFAPPPVRVTTSAPARPAEEALALLPDDFASNIEIKAAKSAAEILAAYKAGRITKEEAAEALKRFGYK